MIIWILSILFPLQTTSQDKLTYDIYYRGKDVGDYEITRIRNGGIVEYDSHSVTKVQFLATLEVRVSQEVRYENGVLVSSIATTRVNGDQHDKVVSRKVGNRYEVDNDGKVYGIGDEINFSVVKLMFKEPKDLGRVFSEIEGEFQRIEQKQPGEYVKTDSQGRRNIYTFDRKAMKTAEVDSGLYRFKMRRRD